MNIEPGLLRHIGWFTSLSFQSAQKAGILFCLGLILFVLTTSPLAAQTDQEVQVAQVYLEQGELEKAQTFYERFYQQRPDRHS